jgi:hypothetical protein
MLFANVQVIDVQINDVQMNDVQIIDLYGELYGGCAR